jgi:hypothetical protein
MYTIYYFDRREPLKYKHETDVNESENWHWYTKMTVKLKVHLDNSIFSLDTGAVRP